MRIKQRFKYLVLDASDYTLDSNNDLEFVELIDSENVLASIDCNIFGDSFLKQGTQIKPRDPDLHLKRLYLRSRLGADKP